MIRWADRPVAIMAGPGPGAKSRRHLARDLLSKVRRDPGYLACQGIEVPDPAGVALDPYALELVRLLLDDERHWGRAAIQAAAVSGETRRLDLAQPMPLLLWYRTLRVGAGGEMLRQPDSYGRDPEVLAALERVPRW